MLLLNNFTFTEKWKKSNLKVNIPVARLSLMMNCYSIQEVKKQVVLCNFEPY